MENQELDFKYSALHEAGHAVIGFLLGWRVQKIHINNKKYKGSVFFYPRRIYTTKRLQELYVINKSGGSACYYLGEKYLNVSKEELGWRLFGASNNDSDDKSCEEILSELCSKYKIRKRENRVNLIVSLDDTSRHLVTDYQQGIIDFADFLISEKRNNCFDTNNYDGVLSFEIMRRIIESRCDFVSQSYHLHLLAKNLKEKINFFEKTELMDSRQESTQ